LPRTTRKLVTTLSIFINRSAPQNRRIPFIGVGRKGTSLTLIKASFTQLHTL
jgi:hypothetical protein